MSEMKYIMIDEIFPIIFDSSLIHREIAFAVRTQPVTSAGFVQLDADGNYHCYGESISLGIKADPEKDSKIINRFLKGGNNAY